MSTPERDVIANGPDREPRRSLWWPVALLGLVVAVAVTVVRTQHAGDRGARPASPVTVPVARGAIVARIPLSAGGYEDPDVALGDGAIWVVDRNARRLLKVSAPAGKVVATRELGRRFGGATAIAYGAGSVWIAAEPDGAVVRIDPRTLRTLARVRYAGAFGTLLAFGAGRLWVMACCGADDSTSILTRVDPRTNKAVHVQVAGGNRGTVLFAGAGGVWTDASYPNLERRDPGTLAVAQRLPGGRSGGPVALAGGTVWTVSGDARLLRIDTATGRTVTGPDGSGPDGSGQDVAAIAPASGRVFTAGDDGRLLQVDAHTLRTVRAGIVADPLQRPQLLYGPSEGLWLANRDELVRIAPDRLPAVPSG